jgi:hypothetical protein
MKGDTMFSKKRLTFSKTLSFLFALSLIVGLSGSFAIAQDEEFTTDFRLQDCSFSTYGQNPYFRLQPKYQLLLKGEEDGEEIKLLITVLDDTKWINTKLPGVGWVKTRVVEEREWVGDSLVEVSRNFFARCNQTNAIYYFGEDVDIYEDGEIVSHEGAWQAGRDGAKPGLIMPGTFLLGSRYYQEIAENAQDLATHVDMGFPVTTEAGTFKNCVEVDEGSAIDPDAESTKRYCPKVGLVFDDDLELVEYGFNIHRRR